MGIKGNLIDFLHIALLNYLYRNLQWKEKGLVFSLFFPRYDRKKQIAEFEKILKDWYKCQGRDDKYEGYSKARSVLIAALKKSVYLVLENTINNTMYFRFATPEEVKEKKRKLKEKYSAHEALPVDYDAIISSNPSSVASSGYSSGASPSSIPSFGTCNDEGEINSPVSDSLAADEDCLNADFNLKPEDFETLQNLATENVNLLLETNGPTNQQPYLATQVELTVAAVVEENSQQKFCWKFDQHTISSTQIQSVEDETEDGNLAETTISNMMDVDVPPSVCLNSQLQTHDLLFTLITSEDVSPPQEDIFKKKTHSLSLYDVKNFEDKSLDDYDYMPKNQQHGVIQPTGELTSTPVVFGALEQKLHFTKTKYLSEEVFAFEKKVIEDGSRMEEDSVIIPLKIMEAILSDHGKSLCIKDGQLTVHKVLFN